MGESLVIKAMFTKDMAGLLLFSLPGCDVPYHRLRTKEALIHGLVALKLCTKNLLSSLKQFTGTACLLTQIAWLEETTGL